VVVARHDPAPIVLQKLSLLDAQLAVPYRATAAAITASPSVQRGVPRQGHSSDHCTPARSDGFWASDAHRTE